MTSCLVTDQSDECPEPPLASKAAIMLLPKIIVIIIIIIDHAFQTGSHVSFRIHLMHNIHTFDTLSLILWSLGVTDSNRTVLKLTLVAHLICSAHNPLQSTCPVTDSEEHSHALPTVGGRGGGGIAFKIVTGVVF